MQRTTNVFRVGESLWEECSALWVSSVLAAIVLLLGSGRFAQAQEYAVYLCDEVLR